MEYPFKATLPYLMGIYKHYHILLYPFYTASQLCINRECIRLFKVPGNMFGQHGFSVEQTSVLLFNPNKGGKATVSTNSATCVAP